MSHTVHQLRRRFAARVQARAASAERRTRQAIVQQSFAADSWEDSFGSSNPPVDHGGDAPASDHGGDAPARDHLGASVLGDQHRTESEHDRVNMADQPSMPADVQVDAVVPSSIENLEPFQCSVCEERFETKGRLHMTAHRLVCFFRTGRCCDTLIDHIDEHLHVDSLHGDEVLLPEIKRAVCIALGQPETSTQAELWGFVAQLQTALPHAPEVASPAALAAAVLADRFDMSSRALECVQYAIARLQGGSMEIASERQIHRPEDFFSPVHICPECGVVGSDCLCTCEPIRAFKARLADYLDDISGLMQHITPNSNVDILCDATDGTIVRHIIARDPSAKVFHLHYDGFQAFQKSGHSVHVFNLTCLNIDKEDRHRHVFTYIIVEGPSEPNIRGLRAMIAVEFRQYGAYIASCPADWPAQAKIAGRVGINGKLGCPFCKMEPSPPSLQSLFNEGGGTTTYVTLGATRGRLWTENDAKYHAARVAGQDKVDYRRRNHYTLCELAYIPLFQTSRHCVSVDYMHTVYHITLKYIDFTAEVYNEADMDQMMRGLRVPWDWTDEDIRLDVSRRSSWTSHQLRVWTHIVSRAFFLNLGDERLFKHWMLFVTAIDLLGGVAVWKQDIYVAQVLLDLFLQELPQIFPHVRSVPAKFHVLTHLGVDVLRNGPGYSHWCFGFERTIGNLKSIVSNGKSPAVSIARRCALARKIRMNGTALVQDVADFVDECRMRRNQAAKLIGRIGRTDTFKKFRNRKGQVMHSKASGSEFGRGTRAVVFVMSPYFDEDDEERLGVFFGYVHVYTLEDGTAKAHLSWLDTFVDEDSSLWAATIPQQDLSYENADIVDTSRIVGPCWTAVHRFPGQAEEVLLLQPVNAYEQT